MLEWLVFIAQSHISSARKYPSTQEMCSLNSSKYGCYSNKKKWLKIFNRGFTLVIGSGRCPLGFPKLNNLLVRLWVIGYRFKSTFGDPLE